MAMTNKDKKGYMLICGVVLIAAVLFGGKLAADAKPEADEEGCAGAVAAETVIVLDHSETLSMQTLEEITARAMAHVREKARTNERVTVFYVSELSKKSLAPAFSRCKPPHEGSRLHQDVKGIAKAFKRDFLAPLEGALKAAPSNGKESPIAQALIDISLSRYLRSPQNTLLVYSDMLEHTPKFSLYSCTDAMRSVALFKDSRKGAQERPHFSQTRVVLNMVPRLDISRATLKCRDQVWAWFFGDNDGASAGLDVDYLPGG